jgi:hypothetical protein
MPVRAPHHGSRVAPDVEARSLVLGSEALRSQCLAKDPNRLGVDATDGQYCFLRVAAFLRSHDGVHQA